MSALAHFGELRLTGAQRAAFLERVRAAVSAEDYALIQGMSYALPELIQLIEQDSMTLRKLRLCGRAPRSPLLHRLAASPAAAAMAQVLVYASGANKRPSWPSRVKTGRKLSVMISSE